jgi:surface protein
MLKTEQALKSRLQLDLYSLKTETASAIADEAALRETADQYLQQQLSNTGGRLNAYNYGHTTDGMIKNELDVIMTNWAGEIWGTGGTFTYNSTTPSSSTYVIGDVTHTCLEFFSGTKQVNEFDGETIELTNTPNTNPPVFWFSNQGVQIITQANETTSGIAKLYNELGTNTDGSVTQDVVNDLSDSLIEEVTRSTETDDSLQSQINSFEFDPKSTLYSEAIAFDGVTTVFDFPFGENTKVVYAGLLLSVNRDYILDLNEATITFNAVYDADTYADVLRFDHIVKNVGPDKNYFEIKAIISGDMIVCNKWGSPILVNGESLVSAAERIIPVQAGETVIVQPVDDSTFRSHVTTNYGFVRGVLARIMTMPSIDKFTTDAEGTIAGDNFFARFNFQGTVISFPAGSFKFDSIVTTGNAFCQYFLGSASSTTTLPAGSFNTGNIVTTGDYFCDSFLSMAKIITLPAGSFDTSNVVNPGKYFMHNFCYNCSTITALPAGSFRINPLVTAAPDQFMAGVCYGASNLTSLPDGSFDTSHITTTGTNFCANFAQSATKLTSLPDGSFDTSNIVDCGDNYFYYFNYNGGLTSLPAGSFRFNPSLTVVKNYFFYYFNHDGKILTLPEGSFDTSHITTMGTNAFKNFNYNGAMTSLSVGSFDTSNITSMGTYCFSYFNYSGKFGSLPAGSFRFNSLTVIPDYTFYYFNYNGTLLTSLPDGSFNFNTVTTLGQMVCGYFNNNGGLTSLPAGSFNFSNVTAISTQDFYYFNYNGQLTGLPAGSFDFSNVTTLPGNPTLMSGFNSGGKMTRSTTSGVSIYNPTNQAIIFFYLTPPSTNSQLSVAGKGTFSYYPQVN